MQPNPYEAGADAPQIGTGWWAQPCGAREVLAIALPLIISTSFTSIMHFVDRLFLTWHSVEAMAASMQAGLAQWTLICFAVGVAMYVNAFVAQYHGAEHDERVGLATWQGIWFGVALTPLFLLAMPLAEPFFTLVGHDESLRREEVTYFQILSFSSGPIVIAAAMSCFFTGRGQAWVTMVVSGMACAVNVVGDYILIFDVFNLGSLLGIEMKGIAGAAWATVIAQWSSVLFYGLWMYQPKYRERFGLLKNWRIDVGLMKRLIYFGGPSGLHMLIEAVGFTMLLMSVGALGPIEAGATTLAFNVNIVAFIPMIGLGIAVSTLVGQQLGNNRPDLATRAVWNGMTLGMLYSVFFAWAYFAVPDVFFAAHSAGADSEEFIAVRSVALTLLKFVAVYFIFDSVQIIFSFAIKGAGDTLFVLLTAFVLAVVGVTIGNLGVDRMGPVFGGAIYWWWFIMTAWIFCLAVIYFLRFLQGKWRTMRVIEKEYAGEIVDPEELVAERV